MRVLLVVPPGSPANWEQHGSLERQARRIPGVTVVWDCDGAEAKQLGARTSGETFLYGTGGELLFRGGITGARGHVGDNYGVDSLRSLLTTGKTDRPRNPVFGCSLFDS